MDLLARLKYRDVYLLGFDGFSKPYNYFFQDPTFYRDESAAWNRATQIAIKVRQLPPTGWHLNTGGDMFEENTEGTATSNTAHGNNHTGYEQVIVSFAAFNGLRLTNLFPNSTLASFVFTQTLDSAIRELESN